MKKTKKKPEMITRREKKEREFQPFLGIARISNGNRDSKTYNVNEI